MERSRDRRIRARIAAALGALALAITVPAAAQAAELPPQGLYEGCAPGSTDFDCQARMQTMADAGFRYVLNYSAWYGGADQVRGLADQAAAAGLQLIWPLNHQAWRDHGSLADTYKKLAADCGECETNAAFRAYAIGLVKDHPATWGFYVGDEQLPTAENVASVNSLATEVKQLAPGKPRLFVTLPRQNLEQNLAPFLPGAEVGGTDYYPVGLEPDLNRFPSVAAEHRRVVRGHGRHSAMVLQSFSWAQYYPSTYPNARFPSRNEMRQMRDLSITHAGPDMILWYSYHDLLETPNAAANWANLTSAAFAPHIQVQGVPPKKCAGKRAKIGVRIRTKTRVRRVKLRVDGRLRVRTAREKVGMPVRGLSPGRHRIRVIATDRSGERAATALKFRRCR